MRTQIGRGLRTGPETHLVYEIGRDDRVDWSEIHIILFSRRRSFHVVFHEGTYNPDNPTEAFFSGHILYHGGHAGFRTGQCVRPVLCPEVFVFDDRCTFPWLFALVEPLTGNGGKVEPCISRGTFDHHIMVFLQCAQFCNHIVLHQYPLAVRERGEILFYH